MRIVLGQSDSIGRMTRTHAARQATILLAVLGATLVVALIGLSAITAMRIQNRRQVLHEDVIQASHYAQSVIDLGLYRIAADSSWRTNYSGWTTTYTIGDAELTFTLSDDDLDLSDNAYDRVVLTGQAQVGMALRAYSVALDPAPPDSLENILKNSSFEDGLDDWHAYGTSTLNAESSEVQDGSGSVYITNRPYTASGVSQVMFDALSNDTPHYAEAYVKMKDNAEGFRMTLMVNSSDGNHTFTQDYASVGTDWTKITFSRKLSWTGTFTYSIWYLHSLSSTQDFYVDNTLLVEGASATADPTKVRIVPGTWKRVVND